MLRNLTSRVLAKAKSARCNRSPAISIPTGHTSAQILRSLRSIVIGGILREEEHGLYLDSSFDRLMYLLTLVPEQPIRALEIGADPYFCTILLKNFRKVDLELTNFFGSSGPPSQQEVRYTDFDGNERTERFHFFNVNIETEPLPFADAHFDLVIFSEVLEHLLYDPVYAIMEIKRVLKLGGTLILTTPNVTSVGRVARLLRGENIYDQYSAYGPYGRHNREYSPKEIRSLIRHCGLHEETMFTACEYFFPHGASSILSRFLKWFLLFRMRQQKDFIFAVCTKRKVEPSAYYSLISNARTDEIHLSENIRELSGFFDLEFDGMRRFRWSKSESILKLERKSGQNFLFLFVGSPNIGRPRTLTIKAKESTSIELKTGWHSYLAPISHICNDCDEIRLLSQPTFRVEGDDRDLGVMLAAAMVLNEPHVKKPAWLYQSYSECEMDHAPPDWP